LFSWGRLAETLHEVRAVSIIAPADQIFVEFGRRERPSRYGHVDGAA
jgi:hypothetical protein